MSELLQETGHACTPDSWSVNCYANGSGTQQYVHKLLQLSAR